MGARAGHVVESKHHGLHDRAIHPCWGQDLILQSCMWLVQVPRARDILNEGSLHSMIIMDRVPMVCHRIESLQLQTFFISTCCQCQVSVLDANAHPLYHFHEVVLRDHIEG